MTVMKSIRLGLVAVVSLLTLSSLDGCKNDPYELEVIGYDYTDRAIADFSVNGQTGGNVFLSNETSGGGKLACCVILSKETKTPFWIDVRYRMDALETYSPRRELEPAGNYVTKRVEVTGLIPPKPGYLEIHFYPDNHIEAAIVGFQEGPSIPRLKLQSRSAFAR
jgi:hypothetical protein